MLVGTPDTLIVKVSTISAANAGTAAVARVRR
jgi:hypothetical protein